MLQFLSSTLNATNEVQHDDSMYENAFILKVDNFCEYEYKSQPALNLISLNKRNWAVKFPLRWGS